MDATDVSAVLWHERELLELLVFKLDTEQLLLTAGRTRSLPHITGELGQVIRRLRTAELDRAVKVSLLALEWAADENVTLGGLACGAPDGPWGEILAAHLKAMMELTGRIHTLGETNNTLLSAAARSTREELRTRQEKPAAEGQSRDDEEAVLNLRLRDVNYQSALAVVTRMVPRTLVDFLECKSQA